MGIFKFLFLLLIFYWIFKAFQRIIAPFFKGYYQDAGRGDERKTNGEVTVHIKKEESINGHKPDINRIDAEDVDFEEIK